MLAEDPGGDRTEGASGHTDPKKMRKGRSGRPEADESDGHPGCVVWEYHRKFNPSEADAIAVECRAAGSDVSDKNLSAVMAKCSARSVSAA